MGVDIAEFETPEKPDFARANGAPMVMVDGKRERYSRPSGFAKPLDDESALTNWRIDTACFGVASDRSLQAAYVAAKRDDRTTVKELREKAINAGRGDEAAALGTAIHAMSERWEDEDDNFDPPEPYMSALRAYSLEMARLGLDSGCWSAPSSTPSTGLLAPPTGCTGCPAAHRTGRLDALRPAPASSVTSRPRRRFEYSMGGFAAQLALYAQGQLYDVVNDEFLPTPEINQDWAIIMWIPVEPGVRATARQSGWT